MLSPSLLYIHVPICLAFTTESRLWYSCRSPQVTSFFKALLLHPIIDLLTVPHGPNYSTNITVSDATRGPRKVKMNFALKTVTDQ